MGTDGERELGNSLLSEQFDDAATDGDDDNKVNESRSMEHPVRIKLT